MSSSQTDIQARPLGAAGEQCAHCGAQLAADQRYCVNCGLRRTGPRVEYRELLAATGPPTVATQTPPPAPDPAPPPVAETRSVSPLGAAVAIGLLLLAVLLGAVIGRGGDDTTPAPVVVGAAGTATAAAFTGDWTGGDGWTVQLVALPKSGTQPAQVAAAKTDAQGKGAAEVGALDADAFASLPGGNYVVYTGRYPNKADAQAALKDLEANFPDATVIEVSTTAAAASGATTGSAGSSSSGEASGGSGSGAAPAATKKSAPDPTTQDFVKKSKKLPDKVGTGGAPPPTDDKAPGDGSEGTTIG